MTQAQTIHQAMEGGNGIIRPDAKLLQLQTLKVGIEFELKCPGMRLTRGPKCTTRARKMFGFKGGPEKLLKQIEAAIEERRLEITVHNIAVTTPTN